MNAIAIIPARGNSKRIPKKNIRKLGKIPMIAFSIHSAVESGVFERVIVSTDNAEIAQIARRYGADVPFVRDANLSDDHTPVSLVSLDALERIDPEAAKYDHIAQLMPNCPFRTAKDVRASFEHFLASGSKSQLSVTRYGWLNPWWAFKMKNAKLDPLFPEALKARSQDLEELFCPTGAIWWATTQSLRENKTFYTDDKTGFELPWEHALDIDEESDWRLAEVLYALERKKVKAKEPAKQA